MPRAWLGTKICGGCGEASYCSAKCQKENWKVHKLSCVDMKKLPLTFLTLPEVENFSVRVRGRIENLNAAQRVKTCIHVTQTYLAFLTHQ